MLTVSFARHLLLLLMRLPSRNEPFARGEREESRRDVKVEDAASLVHVTERMCVSIHKIHDTVVKRDHGKILKPLGAAPQTSTHREFSNKNMYTNEFFVLFFHRCIIIFTQHFYLQSSSANA